MHVPDNRHCEHNVRCHSLGAKLRTYLSHINPLKVSCHSSVHQRDVGNHQYKYRGRGDCVRFDQIQVHA